MAAPTSHAAVCTVPLVLEYPNEDLPLKTIMAQIPAAVPTPYLFPGSYRYHGLSFDHLPLGIQSFLTSYGLNDPAHYTSADVAAVLRVYTDRLIELTRPTCKQIVTIQFSWNVLSIVWLPQVQQYMSQTIAMYHPTMTNLIRLQRDMVIPALLIQVREYLMYADALVWADVAVREGTPDAMTFDEVLVYRHQKIQPVMDRIGDYITELYAWVVNMWEERWRTEGRMIYLRVEPSPTPQKMPVVFPNPGSFVFVPLMERSPPPVYDVPLTSTPVVENRTLSPVTPPSARGVTVGSPPFSPRSPTARVAVRLAASASTSCSWGSFSRVR